MRETERKRRGQGEGGLRKSMDKHISNDTEGQRQGHQQTLMALILMSKFKAITIVETKVANPQGSLELYFK